MKRLFFILFQILITHGSFSQPFVSKNWDARFGGGKDDEMSAICQTRSVGYIIAGTSNSGISGNKTQPNWNSTLQTGDYWIVKIDGNGNYLWDKRYGSIDDDAFMSLSATRDGGYILGGWTGGGISGDKTQNSQGGYDYWVVKIDSLGNKQWDKRFGGSNDDILHILKQTKDGGYILGGASNSPISGDKTQDNQDPTGSTDDYWVVKIDSAGNKQWDKRFGGTSEDIDMDIIQTPDEGYLIGGTSSSDSSGDKTQRNTTPLEDNYWVVKIDSMGNKQWDKRFGGTYDEELGSVLNTTDGNYILGGTSGSTTIGFNKTVAGCGYWLVKIDTSGNELGDWVYGNCGTLYSMSSTLDGGYLMTGIAGEILTIKTDSQMNEVWNKASLVATGYSAYSSGAIESGTGCYLVGVTTPAGVGGDKTVPNWDPTDGTYDYWVVEYCDSFPLGIQSPEGAMNLLVYPNPTKGDTYINIQKDNLTEASFALTSTTGQTVYQSTSDHLAHSYTKILDLSGLPTGVYILEVTVDGERIVKKVLKE